MKKSLAVGAGILIVAAAVILLTRGMLGLGAGASDSVEVARISKAWWPAWDALELGIKRQESKNPRFLTQFLQFEEYVPALEAFEQGKADAATLTIYEALLAASKGVPLKIVLLLDYTIGSDGVVAKKEIASLTDLKGKRIGIEKGTVAHFTVSKMLEKSGLSQADVELIPLDINGIREKFSDGSIDAAGTYAPYLSELATAGNGHVIFSSREIPRSICDVLLVRPNLLSQHPALVNSWLQAWSDVLAFKKNDAQEFLRALSQLNGTPTAELKASFGGIFLTDLAENRLAFGRSAEEAGYLMEALRGMEEFMIQEGVIQHSLPLSELVDNAALRGFKR